MSFFNVYIDFEVIRKIKCNRSQSSSNFLDEIYYTSTIYRNYDYLSLIITCKKNILLD